MLTPVEYETSTPPTPPEVKQNRPRKTRGTPCGCDSRGVRGGGGAGCRSVERPGADPWGGLGCAAVAPEQKGLAVNGRCGRCVLCGDEAPAFDEDFACGPCLEELNESRERFLAMAGLGLAADES